jgi:nicotinamide riboside kinase
MKSIVITGPESSGKTTLLRNLRRQVDATFIPEFARIFLSGKKVEVQFHHILSIAQGQLELYEKAKMTNLPLIVSDTDLLVLQVWSQIKFPDFEFKNFYRWEKRPIDLYLLCKPDIPWEADPLREDPDSREEIFKVFESELIRSGKPFELIGGEQQDRLEIALRVISVL